MNKDNAISYDLANHEQQQHLHPHHHQQQHPHHASWNHQRQQQQQLQSHTNSVYAGQQAAAQNSQSHRGVIGQQQPQPPQQQQPNPHAAQLGSYHHPSQLQSSAHHNSASAAAAYYQSQAPHLYPTYQAHAHLQEPHQPDHLQAPTGVPPSGTNSSNVGLVATNQTQHAVPHQPLPSAIPNTQASVVNAGWSSQGVGSITSQPHHAAVTDTSASLAYMTHPYQSHNSSVGEHHRNPSGPIATQPIGNGPQASSYSVDSLYNSPAAAVAAYNYNNYNAAFFQTSNNAPHGQASHPTPANMSTFWNQNQPQTQQRNAHPQAVPNSNSAQQRQHIGSEQAANFMHDPRVYYGRPTYNQGMQNFSQAPNQPQTNVLHHRMNALSQQHPILHHQDPLTQVPHNQQLPQVKCGGRSPSLTQPAIRPQAGSTPSSILPQSPSGSTSLPMSRPPPQPSLTPDRSPAATHSTSYPSPNQQGSSSKSTSNSLAQLEQMVMPGTGQGSANSVIKSPTQRSTTSSPSINTQPQMQYSFNSSGQGGYFSSTGPGAPPSQGTYYPAYDSSNIDMQQKPVWPEMGTGPSSMMSNTAGPVMVEGAQNDYGQSSYEASGSYKEYTTLSTPNQSRFPPPAEGNEPHSSDKSDPYAIDSQTFDDYDDQTLAKGKKSRAKKSDDKVKKERKPRAPRTPKNASLGPQPQSPVVPVIQNQPNKQSILPQGQEMVPAPSNTSSNNFSSPIKSVSTSVVPPLDNQAPPHDPTVLTGPLPSTVVSSKSPAHRLTTESSSAAPQQTQYSYGSSTQAPSLYQPSLTPDRSPAATQSNSYPSPNQLNSPNKSAPNTIASSDQVTMASTSQGLTNPVESPTQRSTTSSPSINTQPQMQYSFNSSGQGGYFSSTGPGAPPSQGTYYPAYDSSNIDMQQKSSWSDQSSASTSMIDSTNPNVPAMIEENQSSYSQSNYDRTVPYSDYGTYPVPNQSQFHPPDESGEVPSSDKSEQLVIESQTQDDDQNLTKSKKSRAKKSEDKVKKEKKPRAPRAPKNTPGSNARQHSPSVTTLQSQPTSAQDSDLSSALNTDSSSVMPSQQATSESVLADPTGPEPVPPSRSPNHRLSTDSPNITQQMRYSYDSSSQVLTTEPSHVDTSISADLQIANESEAPEEQSTATPKPKKSRAKKSEEKVKKERKPRVPKAPQPAPEPSDSPATIFPDEATTEAVSSEPTLEQTPVEPKPKRIRIRDPSSKGKKKLPKFALKFAKTKKRKRLGSSDNDQSDLDKTPPPSPDEVESGVQKRRSARHTKKLKYNDDLALGFSDSDDESQVLPRTKKATSSTAEGDQADETVIADEPTVFAAPVEDTMVVEKIMSSRMGKRELEPEPGEVLPPDGTHIDVEEFYVKYKNLSYLHCDWRTVEELEKGDRRIVQKIKRYKQKKDSSSVFSFMDEELFDLQYCEVDRILAMNEVEEEVPESDDEQEIAVKESPEATQTADTESETKLSDTEKLPTSSTLPEDAKEDPVNPIETSTKQKTPTEDSTETDVVMKVESENTEDQSEIKKVDEDQTQKENSESDLKKDDETIGVETDCNDNVPQIFNVNSQDSVQPAKPRRMKKKISRHFLVKWRGLSYEESTWELEDHLDPDKINHFLRFKDPPPKSKWKPVKRPKPEDWVRKEASPVYKNNNTLREYQLEGINWLSFCWHQGRNCILADEMGLGKTIQSIAFINEIYEYGINGPYLIIVPLSTVGNWAREFETWTDLNVITYHGSSTSREMLKEYEMFYRNEQGNRITSYYKFQVMITTFEIILSDCLDLREIPWKCCIIDEAHRLKNRNCKLLEGLRLLNMEHRVLLTGTPLQNNVEELFSLLNFLEPTQFSSTEQFLQEFGDLKTEAQVDKLKLILKPMMLRRLKEDVEKTLAPKEETIVEVELTNIQKKYYRAILEKNFSFLTKGGTNNNMPNLMNTMMELRKCCIHPYLINGAEEQIMYEARQTRTAGGEPMSSQQALINSSGKLVLIDKLLPRLKADGHRVLIFSQMVRCLDILEDYVTHKHYPFERIDGRVRGSERQQAIDRFSKPGSDRFVFLLCTRAGGLGINLTAADTVIIFDSDWNPQNDLQAQARCHRIGQSKAVKIYRLICRNTYEREMFDKASLKLGLDKAVLQSMNTQKGGPGGVDGQLTKKEIEELLRKGAYGALMDDDNAGDKFCEEDIDHILQRRTTVITIDNSEAKGSTFSKATFSSSNNREDIELDDPNFWEKWAKKANIDADDHDKDELIQLAPRRRTQTKRYGADGNLLDMSDMESSEEDEETISMRTRGSRGRQPKLTPCSNSKRNKRRFLDFDDDEYMSNVDGGYWSKSDCLKIEKGLLTYGWGRWDKIISSNHFKRDLSIEDCESICRVILLYCVKSYKGDEKIKTFVWELITPQDEANKSQSDLESVTSTRGRKPKSTTTMNKKPIADEISESSWPKEAKNDPLIALPDDQYRRHLQRNCNRLLIRVKFLHYLKNDILKGFEEKILAECPSSEVDLPPVPVDGELPAPWWNEDADKSLLIGIFKHGHDKFNLMRQDPTLCFLSKCGPPNKDELAAEMNLAEKNDDLDKDSMPAILGPNNEIIVLRDSDTGVILDDLVDNVARDVSDLDESREVVDENKNSLHKSSDPNDSVDDSYENGVTETSQTTKMEVTDDDSLTNEGSITVTHHAAVVTEDGEFMLFPSANDLNQRFRRLITAYQRNSKKLEIKMAQKARDELKKERTSKFEAAKNEREERKKFLAQKWSRREEADFFKAISSFGVEYDPAQKRHDWNKFRSIVKLDKKLDETLEEYYKAFIIMCKRVTSRPLTPDEEKCPLNVESITEERALKCLARIEFLSKIREQTLTNPNLTELLKQCVAQNDLPDWWELGKHDRDLLVAAAKHGLAKLDYNLAHDPSLSFVDVIRQKAESLISQPPSSIFIPLEQMQELLDRNGVEYSKDFDLSDDHEEISLVISDIISNIESETSDGKSFVDLVNGPHSVSDFNEKSLLVPLESGAHQKMTRSSTNSTQVRNLPNIISRRSTSRSDTGIQLTPVDKPGRSKVVEITPILPDKLPDELSRSFEAGEITVTIISESALVKLDDRDPIILAGATNPVNIKIRWPRDRAIQTRLENLVALVEKGEWPSPPKPPVPTITLPTPPVQLPTPLPSTPLNIATSSPSKNDRSDFSLGSPTSDTSNISRQEAKDALNDLSTSRNRRNRGRRPKYSENEPLPHELESPRDDRNATAKLRNLLSQGSNSKGSNTPTSDKTNTKQSNSKHVAQSSPLLASFKQKRNDGSSSSRLRGDQGAALDLNTTGAATNLLPQILASLKPEFRDLLANQDAAAMLLNSFTSMTGGKNLVTNLKGGLAGQFSLDNLLNAATNPISSSNPIQNVNPDPSRTSSKGPPPAHQRSDNIPSAHGSSARELRRNSNPTGEKSPPSLNLRSTRGRSSAVSEGLSHHKTAELAHSKTSGTKKRGRPSPTTSESPPNMGTDILDLSSLDNRGSQSSSRHESRARRGREYSDDSSSHHGGKSSPMTKSSSKGGGSKSGSIEEIETTRTTRASKRIGSRIDALALNLQAKKLHRGDSPSPSDDPSPGPNDLMKQNSAFSDLVGNLSKVSGSSMNLASTSSTTAASSSDKANRRSRQSAGGPSMTNPSQSGDNLSSRRSSSSLLANQATSNPMMNQMQTSAAPTSLPASLASTSASLNLANQFGNLNSLGGLLNIPGMNELMKQMSNSFPGLAGGLPKVSNSPIIPNPAPTINATTSSTGNDKGSRRSRQSTTTNTSSMSSDNSSSRRSSSSLLANQSSPQTSQIQTPAANTSLPSSLTNSAASLNFANQFGNLNSLGGLLNFPSMSELMKQMSNFPGLAGSMPKVPGMPIVPSVAPTSNTNTPSNSNEKGSRRSRQSTGASTVTTPSVTSQQAANAALSSFMNLASQPNAATSAYGNYSNPLANPFLPFNFANLGMNNPLAGMGLFPGLYMPPGFPKPDQQQQSSNSGNQNNNSSDGSSKDKSKRYQRK